MTKKIKEDLMMCLKKVNVVNQQCIVCNLYLNVTCIIEAGAGWWQHFW